ncbi:MAG: M15 family metallopeptidase [Proteobacteria bacterium]|nr:M15 family metallopeptidase [Pseudomonadota bacterium]
MRQLPFSSSNLGNPNTSTASNASIDSLISSLSALLLGANTNNEQMVVSLKTAVKDGIIEANKEDARINDAEEREAERRHKELIHHLGRISALGNSSTKHSGDKDKEEKKDDGFGILDALKWAGVAGTIATLIGNLDTLGTMFNDTTTKVTKFKDDIDDYISKTEKFSSRMGTLVDDTFSKDGAIGLLMGAFSPGGLLTKAVLGFFGAVGGGQIGKELEKLGVTSDSVSTTGVAGGLAAMKFGGPLPMRFAEFAGGYFAGDWISSKITGEKPLAEKAMDAGSSAVSDAKKVVSDAANNTIQNIPPLTPAADRPSLWESIRPYFGYDKTVAGFNEEEDKIKQQIKDNRLGGLSHEEFGKLPLQEQHEKQKEVETKRLEYERKLEELDKAREKHAKAKEKEIQDKEDASDPYGARIRKFDREIEKLRGLSDRYEGMPSRVKRVNERITEQEEAKAKFISDTISGENPLDIKLKAFDDEKKRLEDKKERIGETYSFTDLLFNEHHRKQVTGQKRKLDEKIKEVETNKAKFTLDNRNASIAPLQEALRTSGVPRNDSAGQSNYFGDSAITAASIGGGIGLFTSGPLGAIGGAAAGLAMDSATEAFVTAIERYIIDDLKSTPVNLIDLATQNPDLTFQIISKFADDYPFKASLLFGGVISAAVAPGSVAKVFVGILKNIPKLGSRTAINIQTAGGSSIMTPWKTMINPIAGVGAPAAKLAVIAGVGGGGTAAFLGRDKIGTALGLPQQSPSGQPSIIERLAMGKYGDPTYDPLAPTPRERVAMGNNDEPRPSTVPADPSGNASSLTHAKLAGDNRTFDNGKFVNDGLTTVIKTNKGTQIEVATSRAQQFLGFLNELEGKGYKIKVKGGLGNRHGSRTIPNSLHNLGLAIDINPDENPFAKKEGDPLVTDMGKYNVGDMAKRYGLKWGGEWTRPDAMHFEVDKSLRTSEEDNNNLAHSIFGKRALGITGDSSSFGPMGNLIAQILRTESNGGDPDAFYGSGKNNDLLNGKKLSSMTFNELKTFQKAITERQGTSPVGIGQWIGTTLFGKGYNDTGFLKEHFKGADYGSKVFDLDTQKDMLKSFLKSPNHGNLEGFMAGTAGSVDSYAAHLGGQWQGVQKPEEQAKLKATLAELKNTPGLNVDDALNKVMASMSNLSEKTGDFKKMFNGVADQITDAFSSIKDFLSDVTNKAGELLPQEFKDLFNLPEMKEFLDPFLGGESKSTLAHPKRTFSSLESQELRNLLMGTPSISGDQLAASSSALKSAEQRANQQQLGAVINTSSGNGGESIHGQPIAGLSGNINTHFPGDIDAISARIYQWTDAPMFYAAGKL